MHDDGTLRIVQTSGPPDYTFQRWVAVFAPGGWQGLTYDPDVIEQRGKYGFRLGDDPPGRPAR